MMLEYDENDLDGSRENSPQPVEEMKEKMFLHEFLFLVANALDR